MDFAPPRRARTGATLLAAALAATALGGCATSGAVRAAESGDLKALRKAIDADLAAGDLDDTDVRQIAAIIAESDIGGATGPVGVDRVRGFASCARHLDDALERRSEAARDGVAAAAAMVRLEGGLEPAAPAMARALSMLAPSGAADTRDRALLAAPVAGPAADWRAVGARALTGADDGDLRRKLTVDPDQAVRLASLRAAADVADPRDADAVLEAARLDPLPLARTVAIRAAGALGGERVVLALKDLWVGSDEPGRSAIADAWATANSIEAGGRRELLWAAESQVGSPAIAAASALVRRGGVGASDGLGTLTRSIEHGAPKDRIFAIAVAPIAAPPIRKVIRKAEDDAEESVAQAALTKELDAPDGQGAAATKERARLVKKLSKIADGSTTRALAAKGALARAGVREIVPMLQKDVRSTDQRVREAAALGLVDLGELPHAAVMLADPDAVLRDSVACAVLRESPHR